MRGAIAIRIRTCRGGPSAPFADAPPAFRPSFSSPRPTLSPNSRIPNRESLRLRIHPPRSNRENNAPVECLDSLRVGAGVNLPPALALGARPNALQLKNPAPIRTKRKKHPSKFVSVRKKSAVCFLQLTQNLNDTMFRLGRSAQRTRIERKNQKTKPATPFFRIAFSPLNGYPRQDLHSRRCAACAYDH
jgi:hypothetical protein